MNIIIKRFCGAEAEPYLGELARLRIEVFREFPYLYDGSYDYERSYLSTYSGVVDSIIVVAFANESVIGASTGLPMPAEAAEVTEPFVTNGYDPEKIFYFGESVLRKAWRGHGIGVQFFREREAHAAALGRFDWACFCAVQRPDDHPRRPANFQSLDRFWEKRGYRKHPELATTFSWQDLDEMSVSPKPMVFWLKRLARGQ
jgi:GNAT superfamily N-acetyltransferase